MISAEAPILFAKGCDIFITELTMRAWIHAEENKRRTLQRSDIASALSKSDMFDFLIDIVPREEGQSGTKRSGTAHHGNAAQQAAAAAQMGAHGAVQQPQGVYPGQMPEFPADPHMGQAGMYAPPVGQQIQGGEGVPTYGQHPQQVQDPSAFGMYQYPLPQQVSLFSMSKATVQESSTNSKQEAYEHQS